MTSLFEMEASKYWARQYSVVPLRGKAPIVQGWQFYLNGPPKLETRSNWVAQYPDANLGLLTGCPLNAQFNLAVIDCDDDNLVRLLAVVIGATPCSKIGKKGRSDFVRVPKGSAFKSTQIRDSAGLGKIDILAGGKQTVLPPSIHPDTQKPYSWVGIPLLDCKIEDLPEVSEKHIAHLKLIVGSKYLATLVGGQTTHDAALGFVAQLVSAGIDDLKIVEIVRALLPEGYSSNTLQQVPEFIKSAREKFTGRSVSNEYDPGLVGPIPLGRDGDEFHFRCQQTNRLASRSARSLSLTADLLSLAPSSFWVEQFPKLNKDHIPIGIDTLAACNALIQSCTQKGAIEASDIRGFGMWEENGLLVRNTGEDAPESDQYIYSYPSRKPKPAAKDANIPAALQFFQQANWAGPSSAELLLGWCFSSVICGALPWRPHLAITGAAASGKTTQLRGVGELLRPVALVLEGISTEAGIRQNLGYDARPCILDELEVENSGDLNRVYRIVKLMRSASSSTGSVARGTQDGRPHNFCTRASFLVGSINPRRIGAADTSRVVRLEMRPPVEARSGRKIVLSLLEKLKGTGEAFCDLSMSLAGEVLNSIPILHAAMPPIQERQADNLATLLAGYWVALNRRTISEAEARSLVETHLIAVEQQQDGAEETDTTECLNLLLAYPLSDDARTPAGIAIMSALQKNPVWDGPLARIGVRIENDGFLVASAHPGLREVYRSSRWEGGLWSSALQRIDDSEVTKQRRFSEGVRSTAVWIPAKELPAADNFPGSRY